MPENEQDKSEVVITDPDGKELDEQETDKFLKKIQAGVFYIPQNR